MESNDPKQLEKSVEELFKTIETQFPGVTEGLRVLNMSYSDYLSAVQNSQPTASFTTGNTVLR